MTVFMCGGTSVDLFEGCTEKAYAELSGADIYEVELLYTAPQDVLPAPGDALVAPELDST